MAFARLTRVLCHIQGEVEFCEDLNPDHQVFDIMGCAAMNTKPKKSS